MRFYENFPNLVIRLKSEPVEDTKHFKNVKKLEDIIRPPVSVKLIYDKR